MHAFMKRIEELISRPKRAFFFFWPETISKGEDIKIKRIVNPFFVLLPVCIPFIAVLSLFLARFTYMAWKWPKSLVKSR